MKALKDITLTEGATFLFHEVAYSLHSEQSEDGLASDEEVVNHILEEVNAFERIMGYSITEWLTTNHPNDYDEYLKTMKR